MNAFASNTSLLELHVPDFDLVKKYYGLLGFTTIWERQPEEFKGYLVLQMEQNILCFWGGNEYIYKHPYLKKYPKETKYGYGVEIVLMVDDLTTYYNNVKDNANVVEELVLQPWGLWDFRVEDPFGYYLRITTKHNILDRGNAIP